jgi:hypothetical protein
MRILGLTNLGISAAKNIRNPDTPEYRIIAVLYRGNSTIDRLAAECGLTPRQTANIIRHKLKGVVAEE